MIDKNTLGLLASLLGIVGFLPYYWSLYKGKTKPHLFSWIPWAVTSSVAFAGQLVKGAGAGAWPTAVSALLSTSVMLIAIFKGEKNITRKDWVFFGLSMLTIPLWAMTKDPTASVILSTLINMGAYFPTIRKSWNRPHEENGSMYGLLIIRDSVSLAALENYVAVTVMFPLMRFFFNGLTWAVVYGRRRMLESASPPPES